MQPDLYSRYDSLLETGNENDLVNNNALFVGELSYLRGLDNGVFFKGLAAGIVHGSFMRVYAPRFWDNGAAYSTGMICRTL